MHSNIVAVISDECTITFINEQSKEKISQVDLMSQSRLKYAKFLTFDCLSGLLVYVGNNDNQSIFLA